MNFFQLLALLVSTALVAAVPIQQSPTSGVATVSVDADLPADFRLYGLARLPAISSFTLDGSNWAAPTGVTWRALNTGETPITFYIQFKENVCTPNDGFTFLLVDRSGARSFIPNSGFGCSVNVTFNDESTSDSDSVVNKIRGQVYLVRPFGFVPSSTTRTSTTTTTRTSTSSTSSTTRTSTSGTTRTSTSTSRTSTSTTTRTSTSTTSTTTRTSTSTTSTTTRTSTSTTSTTTRTSTSTTSTTTRTSTSTTRTSTSTTRTTTFTSTTTPFITTTTPAPVNFVNRRLNFLLNIKYLAAEYCLASLGRSPSYSGSVNGTVNGGQEVNFTTPGYEGFANELCNDYESHVVALRSFLGGAAVNRPDLNINGGFNSTFSRAIRAAGIFANLPNSTLAALTNYTPYDNELFFFLTASSFADLTAQTERNILPLINNNQNASALLAGIFGSDAYHAGHLRALLFNRRNDLLVSSFGDNNSSSINSNVTLLEISNALAGWVNSLAGGSSNDVQGLVSSDGNANIAPTTSNGLLNGYSARQALDILYGLRNSSSGLFYPNGFLGNLNGL